LKLTYLRRTKKNQALALFKLEIEG
jgi:hypothetical protein